MKKLICKIFGHKWGIPPNKRYKRYCPRCQETFPNLLDS